MSYRFFVKWAGLQVNVLVAMGIVVALSRGWMSVCVGNVPTYWSDEQAMLEHLISRFA